MLYDVAGGQAETDGTAQNRRGVPIDRTVYVFRAEFFALPLNRFHDRVYYLIQRPVLFHYQGIMRRL